MLLYVEVLLADRLSLRSGMRKKIHEITPTAFLLRVRTCTINNVSVRVSKMSIMAMSMSMLAATSVLTRRPMKIRKVRLSGTEANGDEGHTTYGSASNLFVCEVLLKSLSVASCETKAEFSGPTHEETPGTVRANAGSHPST